MTENTPATPAQLDAIIRAARERVLFIRWVADKLLKTDDWHLREEASKMLYQLTEGQ